MGRRRKTTRAQRGADSERPRHAARSPASRGRRSGAQQQPASHRSPPQRTVAGAAEPNGRGHRLVPQTHDVVAAAAEKLAASLPRLVDSALAGAARGKPTVLRTLRGLLRDLQKEAKERKGLSYEVAAFGEITPWEKDHLLLLLEGLRGELKNQRVFYLDPHQAPPDFDPLDLTALSNVLHIQLEEIFTLHLEERCQLRKPPETAYGALLSCTPPERRALLTQFLPGVALPATITAPRERPPPHA